MDKEFKHGPELREHWRKYQRQHRAKKKEQAEGQAGSQPTGPTASAQLCEMNAYGRDKPN
jgi:hypothetical protein